MCDKSNFILITGGRRSGKSTYALELSEAIGPKRLYLATAQALDDEMAERIARHKAARDDGWEAVEEPLKVAGVIRKARGYDVILIDCLTLWLCNVILEGEPEDKHIFKSINELVNACSGSNATVIAVTNELGSGVIPDNPLSRRFTDLAGILNQRMALAAKQVVLTVSGIPVVIKGGE